MTVLLDFTKIHLEYVNNSYSDLSIVHLDNILIRLEDVCLVLDRVGLVHQPMSALVVLTMDLHPILMEFVLFNVAMDLFLPIRLAILD